MIYFMSIVAPALSVGPGSGEPGGPGFLGAVITQGDSKEVAATYAANLINVAKDISDVDELEIILYILPNGAIGKEFLDRILTADEVATIPEPAQVKE